MTAKIIIAIVILAYCVLYLFTRATWQDYDSDYVVEESEETEE